jgi:hypothetical protein
MKECKNGWMSFISIIFNFSHKKNRYSLTVTWPNDSTSQHCIIFIYFFLILWIDGWMEGTNQFSRCLRTNLVLKFYHNFILASIHFVTILFASI